jgi:hypothetical protein
MKKIVRFIFLGLLSLLLVVACKSPSQSGGGAGAGAVCTPTVEVVTDTNGNKQTTTTECDGTVKVEITDRNGNVVTTTTPPVGVDNLGNVGGIWRGTFTPDDRSKLTTYYKAFITPSRQMVMLSDSEASLEVQGSDMLQSVAFSQTSEAITINLKEYVKENDGTPPLDVVITANLIPVDSIKGTYVRGAETGQVLFIYDPVYERGDRTPFFYTQSTYWKISKTLVDGSTYQAAFSVNDSFKMKGVGVDGMILVFDDQDKIISFEFPAVEPDTEGCNYDGNLDVVDTHYFIYNITLKVTGAECPLVGVYTGLATLEEEYTIEQHPHTHYEFMTFGVSDGERTINNRLTLDFFGV